MINFREQAAEGLKIGDTFTISRTFTCDDIALFAKISGDYNPVHFDERFAKAKKFSAPICHGLLTASLITEIGGQIAWLASGMKFKFKAPVYVGETITCTWTIVEIDKKGRAKADITITKTDGVTVLEAEIKGIIPMAESRDILRQMLSEGDPTNGLTNSKNNE